MTPLTNDIGEALEDVALALRSVTVSVRSASGGTGSRRRRGPSSGAEGAGIVWSSDGIIVTNAHVATGDSATITLGDGSRTAARVVVRDERADLALLRVDGVPPGGLAMRAAVIGEPATLRAGDVVLALGHPLGVEHALAMGVVYAAPKTRRSRYVVADIRLAPGNSGGPLADARGRIVGVNCMIVGGLGVAVSVDAVRKLLTSLAPRPVLGVQLRPVRVRVPIGSPHSVGLLVLALDSRGAAANGGILQGDLLLGHAGHPFKSEAELADLLRRAGPGGTLRFDVGRGGRKIACEVILGVAVGDSRRAA